MYLSNVKPAHKYILRHYLLLFLLFTALGSFLYVLVLVFGAQAEQHVIPVSVVAFVVTVLMVNVWGFGLLTLHTRISKSPHLFYTKKRRLLTQYYLLVLSILLVNYLSFVFIRWLFDNQLPFALSFGGGVLLYTLWFLETIVASLIFIEYATRVAINLYKEREQLRKSVEKAQYQALQSQLNPHFLFNNLSVLIAEIEYDPKNAVRFTRNLSEIYRYILHQQHKIKVVLQEEMHFLDAYVFLFRTRLGDCMRIHNGITEEALMAYVPPLTLQLLLENIFKHNYMSDEEPMDILLEVIDQGARLKVSNTLRPRKNRAVSGYGLENLGARVQIVCGRMIEIDRSNHQFTVIIPLLYE